MKNASLLIHPCELSKKWVDRLVKENIPTLALHPEGGKNANETLECLVEKFEEKSFRDLLDYAAEKGLKIEYEMHAARYLLPETYFDEHPEWFRMNAEGERTTDYNLCPSSEEAIDVLVENAAELAKKLYRSTDRYYFWLDDAKDSHCHCQKCREMSPSDQQMKILNRMIKRMRQDNSKATLAYLAYCGTIDAPTNVLPEDGIFLEYAPFLRDFHRPLREDAESKPLEKLLELFGKDSARALDYWYDNSLYSKWKKPPVKFSVDKEVLRADMSYYKELGFEDVASFACFLGDDYEALWGDVDVSDFGREIKNN